MQDREEALDVVQEAMYTLVRSYATKPDHEWPVLFHRILQSRIRDWYRRRKVLNRWRQWFGGVQQGEKGDTLDPLEAIPDLGAPRPDVDVMQKRAVMELEQALQALPPRQQQVFLLRAWEELDVAQTAQAMGCSAGSVKTHYFRAIQFLRKRLGDHWP